jgi:heterodisulfide reductase subunit C
MPLSYLLREGIIPINKNMNNIFSSLLRVPGDQCPEYCHQCGKCSSGCPSADYFDFRPRRIIAMVQIGFIEELLESEDIWKCAQCLACKERCPRDVAPYDVIQALQNLAFERNLTIPKGYSTIINSILKEGIIQKPTKVRVQKYKDPRDKTKRHFEFHDRTSLNLGEAKKPIEIKEFTIALKKALKGDKK